MKFRIWDADQERFFYSEDSRVLFNKEHPFVFDENFNKISSDECVCDMHTGYKDVNGNPIYQQDIVDGLVGFLDGIAVVDSDVLGHLDMLLECRVIGNVYQNQDLIP